MKSAKALFQVGRSLGWRWLLQRGSYSVRLRLGLVERSTPLRNWDDTGLSSVSPAGREDGDRGTNTGQRGRRPQFLFEDAPGVQPARLFRNWDGEQALCQIEVEALRRGRLKLFGGRPREVGFPPAWHVHPESGCEYRQDIHWSRIPDFGPDDIKVVWEPARFGFAYLLARAYRRTGEKQCVEDFWCAVESWRRDNPPNHGVHWKCGQEIALRAMAWCFGLYAFLDSPLTTQARVDAILEMLDASAERIEANIGYALGQKNNHGLSEAAGLFTVGCLVPDAAKSQRLRRLGRELLEQQVLELFDEDGAFSQYSVNYHRLALQVCVWSASLAECQGQPLGGKVLDRLRAAAAWLGALVDKATGGVPRYGPFDGALALPLSNCGIGDFRPALQAAAVVLQGRRRFEPGPWDEEAFWLTGRDPASLPGPEAMDVDFEAQDAGYFVLRDEVSSVFTRCGKYRFRPGHADLMHVDLSWRDRNVAIDPGTFSYNAPEPWANPLARTRYHNTVTVEDLDQMDKAGRFLWCPWPHAAAQGISRNEDAVLSVWQGYHDGFERRRGLGRHQRAIVGFGGGQWLVLDRLGASAAHRFRLHWLLADVPHAWDTPNGTLRLDLPEGQFFVRSCSAPDIGRPSLVRAESDTPRGWMAPTYGEREPALSFALEVEADNALFATWFGPEPARIRLARTSCESQVGGWTARVEFSEHVNSLVDQVEVVNSANSRQVWV